MARATAQKAAIAEALTAAQTALGMVVLGASDADITAAGEAIAAITAAIEAAADVDDTSMYSAQVTLLNGSLATATALVHQDRAAKKMARADMQKGAIAAAIEAAKTAVAAIADATEDEVAAAAMTAGEKVQAARDAIAAAVDVDDTSMYTATVDGLETSVGTAATTARSAYQSGKIMAALSAATTAVEGIALGASDEMIEAAKAAVQAAKDAIEAAADVDDTSMHTATVNGLDSTLTKTVALVQEDRDAKAVVRADAQQSAITTAIEDAKAAVALVVDGANDEVIEAAETAIQDAKDAIAAADDVDDTSMYTTTVDGLATGLAATKITVLANRAAQNTRDEGIAAARTMATEAMDAAKTASDNAEVAAAAATDAEENRATMQTGEKSGMYAMAARDHAKMAKDAYMDAKAASEAADAAETVNEAVRAQFDAEKAQEIAEEQATMASADRNSATAAVDNELFIDGTVKSVGDTEVDATAGYKRVTVSGSTTITGLLLDMNPTHTVSGMSGQAFAVDDPDTADTNEAMDYRQAYAGRTFPIGKTLDSSDDKARLMLVTAYAGTETVKVYANAGGTNVQTIRQGRLQTAGFGTADDATDDVFGDAFKKVGTYYQAGADTDTALTALLEVSADAEGETVYSYVNTDGETVYLVEDMSTRETTGTGDTARTEYTYQHVDITAVSLPDSDDEDTALDEGQVTGKIPAAAEYKHIHFGVWAGLGAAKDDGSQAIADLGIGFVQNHSGSGQTANMPLQGDATYEGDWVATVQAADEDGDGGITLRHGPASLMVDFEDDEITVDLMNLAMLKGDIDGSTFGGEDNASDVDGMYDLNAAGTFKGSFSGAFYGSRAAEAGGIFDYSSDGMEDGAFRGAFGADKKTD